MRTPGDRPPEDGGGGNTGPAGEDTGPPEAGRVLAGRYRVTGRLGRGGMGVVWRAVDDVLGREVAVKELRTFTDAATGELDGLRTRMQREARAAARVRHSGVVSVHDVAQHEGRPVIVMELVEGPSLDDVLRERGTLEPREAAAIGAAVMDALAAAHRAGVLHRDVKPGNVLLENGSGRVVLTDFGIASMEDPDDGAGTQLTGSGELVGSLDYLAPERARGEAPREACDVWALGATLYAAVEGAAPFRRTSTWSTLNAIVVEPLPEPQRAGPLAPVLAELMDKDPAKRADAERAKALLTAVAKGTAPPAGPSETMRLGPGGRSQARRQGQVAAAGAAEVAEGQGQSGQAADSAANSALPPRADAPRSASGAASEQAPAALPPASGHSTGTDRHTVHTRAGRSRGHRRTLLAAAVAAVVLTGAGGTYAVMSQTGGDGGNRARGGSGDDRTAGAGKHETGKGEDSVPERNGPSSDGRKRQGDKAGASAGAPGDGKGSRDGTGDSRPADDKTGGSKPGAAGGSGGDSGGGGGGAPSPEPACHARGDGKFDCTVWKTATSYNGAHKPVGRLNAGTNYFFCQKKLAHRETSGQWTNVWWAKTDDDSGNSGVFVSDVYIKGGDNDRPVPGLPVC
ncbi:serine/threonine protein kinase [Streptomyces sp. WMMB 322]|uniref:serine/threonine protein kinase n=1 Tax=Streptomyces sp. WMMB 322 TaxID=1286821 RepID=UPI0006E396FB|nr:serine/threonine protein kinase [Streptomyces sp. WMMB 322]SCK57500.1 Serine/threonine protein kinase [Streptomyces sp. WMMB 322]